MNKIYTIREWNSTHTGSIMAYTLGNGSMYDEPRQRGYVVQKRHTEGGERSKYHSNKAKALQDYNIIW